MQNFMLLSECGRNFPLAITYFVCFKPTPFGFLSIEHRSPPRVPRPHLHSELFIKIHISDISGFLVHRGGGTMFYKIISVLVDYIVKK